MAKITLPTISSGYATNTQLNEAFDAIEAEFQNKVLYRNNTSGEANQMENSFDMNSNRILNLPEPLNGNEAARLTDVNNALAGGAANLITATPYSHIAATTVQGFLQELTDEKTAVADLASTASGKGAALIGRGSPVVSSITALRALLKTSPAQHAFVTGYYAQGDGGGGAYWYDSSDTTSSDNGGTIIVATDGGRWKLVVTLSVSLKQFGAKGDGTTDDTTFVQAAFTWAMATHVAVYVPKGDFRCTAQLNVTKGVKIFGDGVIPYEVMPATGQSTRGAGSWFFFDHTGVGIYVNDAGAAIGGFEFTGVGTYRTQTIPAEPTAFTPTVMSEDILLETQALDTHIHRVCFYNPYKAVRLKGAGGGRLNIEHIIGQPLLHGIDIEEAGDVCRLSNIHWWPVFSQQTNVYNYSLDNVIGVRLGRCDNPMLSGIFTIWCLYGLQYYVAAAGVTQKAHVQNSDFDQGRTGIRVEAAITTHNSMYSNITIQGADALASGNVVGLDVAGSNATMDFTNLDIRNSRQNNISIGGTGAKIGICNYTGATWDYQLAGFPSVEVASGSTVVFAGHVKFFPGTTTTQFGGAGSISGYNGVYPSLTVQTGTIKSQSAPSAAWFASVDDTTPVSINNGVSYALANSAGLIIVSDRADAQAAVYLCSGGTVILITQTGTVFVAGSPAAGKIGVEFAGGVYKITNNKGSNSTFGVIALAVRQTA